jgi:hypothetical protein
LYQDHPPKTHRFQVRADHLTADLICLDDIEQCAIVRAFFRPGTRLEDPDLHYFNSRYENTRLPTEYL